MKHEDKVDFDAEPCQKVKSKIQNNLGENGGRQPYKLASQTKLWTFVWLVNLVGTCLYLAIIGIYAFVQMRDLFLCNLVVVIKVCQGDL